MTRIQSKSSIESFLERKEIAGIGNYLFGSSEYGSTLEKAAYGKRIDAL